VVGGVVDWMAEGMGGGWICRSVDAHEGVQNGDADLIAKGT